MLLNRLALAVATVLGATGGAAACSLSIGGVDAAMAFNSAAMTMSSEPGLGAVVTVGSTILDGPFRITVSAPSWVEYPTDFDPGTASLRSRHVSLGTLNINAGYDNVQHVYNFGAMLVSAAALTIHHRITAPSFEDGRYRTRTLVTCS
ncbi:MAG: hypothetical protein ACO1OG_06040 [Devosia sp.]